MKWIKREPKKRFKESDSIIDKLAKIHGIEDLKEFLHPTTKSLNDPYLLANIDVARFKICRAINEGAKIAIFADIDADGICSTAIMYNYLRNFTDNVVYFHAQRSDGHGISNALHLIPEGTDLLIIVDSSTSEDEACAKLNQEGIDTIILDHHPAEKENPFALIVNPLLSDNYPNKFLSGAGVVWQMCRVLDDTFGTEFHLELVDLAGIGIHADQMHMMEPENRILVHMALENISNFGIHAIMKANKRDTKEMSSTDIAFTIAPTLNGGARLDKIELVLELLTSYDNKRCTQLAKEIKELNDTRKSLQADFVKKLKPQINPEDKIAIVVDTEIGKGFAGLVANDLAQKMQMPVAIVVPSASGKVLSGSFRSINDFPLRSALEGVDGISFLAGHQGAGGVGIYASSLDKVRKYMNKKLSNADFGGAVIYDLELHVDDIDEQMIQEIMKFTRICGQGMPEARFKITGLYTFDKTLMGGKNDTIKVECDNDFFLMKFRSDEEFFNGMPIMKEVKAVGTLNLNKFMNWKLKQLQITKQLFLDEYVITS